MASFRTFDQVQRVPAQAMQKVIDPADWTAESLGPVDGWSYFISDRDADELIGAVAAFRRKRLPLVDVDRGNFALGRFAAILADVRQELIGGRGIVMLKDFPLERLDREGIAIAYLGLGSYLGDKMMQNLHGHVLGHVKDLGGDYTKGRGYDTNAELRFHTDGCAYVGLLCLQTSKSGGASRVASSVRVYNTILERRPDLCELLCQDYYRDNNGEMSEGEKNYFTQPIFSFTQGYFSATGAGATLERAQKLPDVPKWTPAQREAVEIYRAVAEEVAVDIDFVPGDIQFLSNYVALHTRRAFEDWPEARRKRHLLRLWLGDPDGRPIPKEQREGRSGRGIQIKGLQMSAPLDVERAA
ncbi:MAG TPA: TauD/TfdA family dioxygenase [Beijerinckiaceae bacterium]|jgi:hypothetical protein|nr:TauD/TfdA family dioxygenase [Beijerinckiaceae bacterium]